MKILDVVTITSLIYSALVILLVIWSSQTKAIGSKKGWGLIAVACLFFGISVLGGCCGPIEWRYAVSKIMNILGAIIYPIALGLILKEITSTSTRQEDR